MVIRSGVAWRVPASMSLPPRHLVVRDLAVLAATALAWLLDARLRAEAGVTPVAVGVAAGVLAAVSGFLGHEWGHLAGSLASGSRVHYPGRVLAPLLFHFDAAHNDRRQFLWMSFGGYAATLVLVTIYALVLPRGAWSGRVGLLLTVAGTVATFVLEMPITVRALRGEALPDGFAYRPPPR